MVSDDFAMRPAQTACRVPCEAECRVIPRVACIVPRARVFRTGLSQVVGLQPLAQSGTADKRHVHRLSTTRRSGAARLEPLAWSARGERLCQQPRASTDRA